MKRAHFGRTAAGDDVHEITLRAGEITARILTYGATLGGVHLAGVPHGLTLGPRTLAEAEGPCPYHGALVGPVANRIAGATATLDETTHHFEKNEFGKQTLHSGSATTSAMVWDIDESEDDDTDSRVTLRVTLPDCAGGFPGNRTVFARFEVEAPGTLRLTVSAFSDAQTWLNFANHSYWNLDGTADWSGHRLAIAADHYLPVDDDTLPTGEIAPVAGTLFDFRNERLLARDEPPLDHNFCLSDGPGPVRDVLWLTGGSGLRMTMATTAPGMQVYDGRNGRLPGRAFYEGLALEPQGWPDAPNRPEFPSVVHGPDRSFYQVSEWRFDRPAPPLALPR